MASGSLTDPITPSNTPPPSPQGNCMLQKFIKGRGLKASVVRVFWRATACGAGPSGTVTGWFITQANKKFACYQGKDKDAEETFGTGRFRPKSASREDTTMLQRQTHLKQEAAETLEAEADAAALAATGDAGLVDADNIPYEVEEDQSAAWKRRHAARLTHVLSSKQIANNLSDAAVKNEVRAQVP